MTPNAEATRLLEAVRFAAEKHRDHRRKGITAAPYINHPIQVASQLANAGYGGHTELLMAAMLHDVVEDTETTAEELAEVFGKSVAEIVLEVSDDKSLHFMERKRLVVQHIASKSLEAKLVKLSDLVANVYDIIHHPPNWDAGRISRYLEWAFEVAQQLRGIDDSLEKRFHELVSQAGA